MTISPETLARLVETQRHRWMMRMLLEAMEDMYPPEDWDGLCRLAVQYGGRAVERPTAAEFGSLRHMTVGQLLGMDPSWH